MRLGSSLGLGYFDNDDFTESECDNYFESVAQMIEKLRRDNHNLRDQVDSRSFVYILQLFHTAIRARDMCNYLKY